MSKSTRLVKTSVGASASRRNRTVASSEVGLSPVWSETARPRPEKMSPILPTPMVRTPAFSTASSTVGPAGGSA